MKIGKKLPILVDQNLEIKDPLAPIGPIWDGGIVKTPQVQPIQPGGFDGLSQRARKAPAQRR